MSLLRRACTVAFLALMSAWSLAQTSVTPPPAPTLTPERKQEILTALEKVILERAFTPGIDFSKWAEHVKANQEAIDQAEDINAFGTAINRTLRNFGLSHFRLASPRQTERRGQTSAVGIGAAVSRTDEGLRVRSVAPESPAGKEGLRPGDVITTVNGQPPSEATAIEGAMGDRMKLTVKSEDGSSREVEITVQRFSTVRRETLTWKGEDAAVLRVYTFASGYGRENLERLVRDAAKAKYLVLDLRSNGGGAVNNLNHLLSLLLPDNTAYGTFVSRNVSKEFEAANPGVAVTPEAIASWAPRKATTRRRLVDPFAGKIAVLINRGSASASEIAAAALKENRDALIVGSPTAGAVLASTYARLPEGFSLQFPISDFVTIKGRRLEKAPLQPDVTITEPIRDGVDPVMEKALELLRSA